MLIRSSKKKNENPYVAKISSIWQEGGEAIMLTVFWYYRPEDTTKNVSALFHEVWVGDVRVHLTSLKEYCFLV